MSLPLEVLRKEETMPASAGGWSQPPTGPFKLEALHLMTEEPEGGDPSRTKIGKEQFEGKAMDARRYAGHVHSSAGASLLERRQGEQLRPLAGWRRGGLTEEDVEKEAEEVERSWLTQKAPFRAGKHRPPWASSRKKRQGQPERTRRRLRGEEEGWLDAKAEEEGDK